MIRGVVMVVMRVRMRRVGNGNGNGLGMGMGFFVVVVFLSRRGEERESDRWGIVMFLCFLSFFG